MIFALALDATHLWSSNPVGTTKFTRVSFKQRNTAHPNTSTVLLCEESIITLIDVSLQHVANHTVEKLKVLGPVYESLTNILTGVAWWRHTLHWAGQPLDSSLLRRQRGGRGGGETTRL